MTILLGLLKCAGALVALGIPLALAMLYRFKRAQHREDESILDARHAGLLK